MSYVTYRSEGIVLGGASFGEGNRYVAIFTRDFGLVNMRVQGVRTVQSKFRCHLEDYALTQIGFVRGRDSWRLTNAVKVYNIDARLMEKPRARRLAAQLISLLKRLAPPDEPYPALYDDLRQLFEYFLIYTENRHEINKLEYIVVARILHAFGYFSSDVPFTELFTNNPMSSTALMCAEQMQKEIRNEINRSLRSTHL